MKFVWYDGSRGEDPNRAAQNFPPDEILEGEDPRRWDLVLVGEKGKMFFNRGPRRNNPAWATLPRAVGEEFEQPEQTLPRVPNEDVEWVNACKGGPPALSNFSYSGPFTEMVLLGNVAIRTGKKITWDAERLMCPNAPDAERYIRREYRKGWVL